MLQVGKPWGVDNERAKGSAHRGASREDGSTEHHGHSNPGDTMFRGDSIIGGIAMSVWSIGY